MSIIVEIWVSRLLPDPDPTPARTCIGSDPSWKLIRALNSLDPKPWLQPTFLHLVQALSSFAGVSTWNRLTLFSWLTGSGSFTKNKRNMLTMFSCFFVLLLIIYSIFKGTIFIDKRILYCDSLFSMRYHQMPWRSQKCIQSTKVYPKLLPWNNFCCIAGNFFWSSVTRLLDLNICKWGIIPLGENFN